MYHPRCAACGSPKTIKWGAKRWRCKRCGRTFRLRRGDVRDRAAVAGYVLDRSTFARLGERWKVDRSTAYRRVMRALVRRRTPLERTRRLLAGTDGVCLLDGKHVRVSGRAFTVFLAWDRGLGRPIHFLLKEGGESQLWYWRLMVDLRHAGYEPKAFISDGFSALKEFVAQSYPGVPHQRCAVHVFLRARSLVARGGLLRTERSSLLVELLKRIIWSETLADARRRLAGVSSVAGLSPGERRAARFVADALAECFVAVDPRWSHLGLPRSSNAIENAIGQIEARLKTRRGSKSVASLERLVNELVLRVKRQVTNR
jgi:hypothetical protein